MEQHYNQSLLHYLSYAYYVKLGGKVNGNVTISVMIVFKQYGVSYLELPYMVMGIRGESNIL